MMNTARRRGFTVLELLISTAISSIIIAAAVSVFVALASQQRTAERLVEAQSSTMVAMVTMQMDVGNAGYRFPLPAFAVRHIEVDSATSLPSNGTLPITSSANCDSAGLVEGTDVLELAEGFAGLGPGKALSAAITSGVNVGFTLGNRGEPFSMTEATGGTGALAVGSVLAFANAAGVACLVKVTSLDSSGMTSGTGTLIDRDYAALGVSPGTFYPGCPAADMDVYRLGGRTRYMICKPTSASTNMYSLYRQTSTIVGAWNPPVKLQEGIEDLQVSLGYSNADGGIAATGSSPTCVQGAASGSYCYCDDKVAGACSLTTADVEPGLTSITPGSRISLVRGIRVQLTGMGQRTALALNGGLVNTDYRRPDSFDHAGMATSAADSYLRVQQQFSFAFQNLQVVP